MSSSEDVRLSVEHVKCKKTEGTLYLMNERIGWMPKDKDIFVVSHHYADIKVHKISSEGKKKVRLQIIMYDDSSETFDFISPSGTEQQVRDRDSVKDQLSILLPKFKLSISRDLEEKKRVLLENPKLYQLYSDIVVTSIISAEDFWKHYADMPKLREMVSKSKNVGVSQSFLSSICPKSDSANGITYNITVDDIQAIFKTYPSVKQKYMQNVPMKMSESDFWTKFFQSHYFHRDRVANSSADLFSECAVKDDEDLKSKAAISLKNPLFYINNQKDSINEDGFGLTDFQQNKIINVQNHNLLKRYNYYSIRILSSMEEANGLKIIQQQQQQQQEPKSAAVDEVDSGESAVESTIKKSRFEDEIDDLTEVGEYTLKGQPLNLIQIDRYFYGPTVKTNETDNYLKYKFYDKNLQVNTFKSNFDKLNSWNFNLNKNGANSLAILKELSPGGGVINASQVHDLQNEIPKNKQDEMRMLYSSLCEILRHFWACFPPTTEELENKFNLMKETLEGFQQNKINVFRDKLLKENLTWNLTSHMENLIQIALARYDKWKQKIRN